jgi:hypothetical protein
MSATMQSVEEMRQIYRDLAVQWDEARDDPTLANKVFRRLHALAKEHRASAEGRTAIEGLLDDAVAAVRLVAATDSLAWHSSKGIAVLEDIEQNNSSLFAVDAKWTLRSYRSGKLDLDW